MAGQPLGGVGPVRVVVGQVGDVDIALDPEVVGHLLPALPHPLAALFVVMADRLHRQPTARGAERGDLLEKPVLGVGGQIHEQAFSQPRGGTSGVKAGRLQRCGPVLPKVDRHLAAHRGGLGTMIGQSGRLVVQHLGLVDLVDHGARRPLQPVGAGVQTRRKNDDLPDSSGGGIGEECVEEQRPHRLVGEHVVEDGGNLRIRLSDPLPERIVKEVLPHASTGTGHQYPRVGVANQWVGALGLPGPGGGHHHGGRSHTGGDVPAVVVAAQVAHDADSRAAGLRAGGAGSSWPGRCRAGTAGSDRV